MLNPCLLPVLLAMLPVAVAAQAQPPASAPQQQQQTTPVQPAQQLPAPGQPGSVEEPFIYRTGTNLVDLVFTVTDNHGRFITGLQKSDFGLLDNKLYPDAVISFTQQTNLPLRIGVMLDTSSSIRTRFHFEQEAALDFFRQVLHANDRAFIEGFDIDIARPQGYTNNLALLDAGIQKLRPGGGTALYDSLYRTCRDEMLTLRDANPVRKAIILVSDGDDNYSRATQSDAIKMCQRAETIVYAISTDDSPTRGKGGDVLEAIANATGGQVSFPTRVEDVSGGFRMIEDELRSQYSIVYRPADFKADGSFRIIQLQTNKPQYHVRAKKGYFATNAGKAPDSVTPPPATTTPPAQNAPKSGPAVAPTQLQPTSMQTPPPPVPAGQTAPAETPKKRGFLGLW